MSAAGANRWGERPPERLEQRIAIEDDGTVVARSGKVEYGQGIRTGFAKIVAEELAVPIERVRMEMGETDRVPWDMGTFGSLSTATDGKLLRKAAAFARQVLLERAAACLGVAAATLKTENGRVVAPGGRSMAYAELAAAEPLAGMIPETVPTTAPSSLPEDSPFRLEALAIVTGSARYSADVRLPGMLYGQVLHAPLPGGGIASLDEGAARALPGVMTVIQGEGFAGVVAKELMQAVAAARALAVKWKRPDQAPGPAYDAVLRGDPGVGEALAAGGRVLSAHFHVPHISHAPIGPSVAVADVREDEADLYVTTQRPFGLRDQVAQLLGLGPERVHIHPQMMSGTYGRANMADAALDAARLSRAVKRPVLVQWGRDEEFRSSPHRPVLDADISAALNPDGTIAAWRYFTRTNPHTYGGIGAVPPGIAEITSGRNSVPPYRVGAAEVRLHVEPAPIRTGAFRSLAAAPNVFVIESFMDELARASGQDPIAFRLRHIEDERLRRVVCAVRDQSDWEARPREPGRGFGMACTIYHGTYIAEVAEIRLDAGGQIHVERVWAAVDAGRLVHPDGARNQIEGGIQQAVSWTLFEELPLLPHGVASTSFLNYPIATFPDAVREISVTFLPAQELPSTGVGEPGSVPLAAAVANALRDACGARARRLPLTPQAVSLLRKSTT